MVLTTLKSGVRNCKCSTIVSWPVGSKESRELGWDLTPTIAEISVVMFCMTDEVAER